MKIIYEFLKSIQDEVGCGCSVHIWIDDEPDFLAIRIDWPNDFHLLYKFTKTEIMSVYDTETLRKEIIYIATKEYKLKTVGEE